MSASDKSPSLESNGNATEQEVGNEAPLAYKAGTAAEQKEFARVFHDGLEFWTSEDGTLLAVVIDREEGWHQRLRFHHQHLWESETFDASRAKPRFLIREWAGKDFFDGGFQRRGKIWRLCDEETPFPVMEYELQIPR